MTSVLQLSLLFLEEEAIRIQQWLPLVPVTLDQYIAYPISFPKENLQCFPGKAMRGQNAATSRCRDYRDQIFRVDFRDPKRVELRKWAFNTAALANLGNNARDAVTTGALPGTFRSLLEDGGPLDFQELQFTLRAVPHSSLTDLGSGAVWQGLFRLNLARPRHDGKTGSSVVR